MEIIGENSPHDPEIGNTQRTSRM
jgi:hypothetical protein